MSSTTTAATATTVMTTTSAPDLRLCRPHLARRRRLSTPPTVRPACISLPHSLEALDLPAASPAHTLASLRFFVLSYLADLESRLAALESPIEFADLDVLKEKGGHTVDEARTWARVALEMLDSIRADVCSHIPADFTALRSALPDFGLAEMRDRLDDVRARFSDFDFHTPLSFIPTLSERLHSLHTHLSEMDLPSLPEKSVLSDLLDSLLSSELVKELLDETSTAVSEGEDLLERAAKEVANAVKRSFEGARLIKYADLPEPWRNNPYISCGYRFIPIERWHLIVLSLFAFHNETLNIHTHLIPFLVWSLHCIPLPFHAPSFADTPEAVYTVFSLLTLLLSVLWHTMAGCAHPHGMDFCARVDYAGIGWLISASIGTVVYYGFQCNMELGRLFLVICLVAGVTSSTLPFMTWFNQIEYRIWRLAFFVGISFAVLIAPLVTLSYLYSTSTVLKFISPVLPSLVSYILGFLFYATHFPERFISSPLLDAVGAGSHAIWHAFIVLAISQHRTAMDTLRLGLECTV